MNIFFQRKLFFAFYVFIFLVLNSQINAQSENLVDSLLSEINTNPPDSTKITLFNHLANIHQRKQPNLALDYLKKGLLLAEKNNYYADAVNANHYIGSILAQQGLTEEAFPFSLKATEICRQNRFDDLLSRCLNNLGLIYSVRGDWNKAFGCFNEGLRILDSLDINPRAGVEILSNIGSTFAEQKDYKQAKKYYKLVHEKTKEMNDSFGISLSLTNIGEMLAYEGKEEEALAHYDDALAIFKSINYQYGIAYLYTNIGIIHFDNGEFEIAQNYLSQAMEIVIKINATYEKIRIYKTLAAIEQNKKNYISVEEYCTKGLALAETMKSKNFIKDFYKLLGENYELQKEFKEALKYQKLFKAINDTLFNDEKSRQISELSIQYETGKKEAENQLLKEEQAKNEALLERRTTLNWTIFLFLVLVSVIAYSLFRNNKRKEKYNILLEEKVEKRTKALKNSNAKLKRSNSDLEQFAYITSHDLKEPLRNITSFTSLIAHNLGESIDKDSKEYMSIVQTNVSQMHALIEGVLSYARVKKIDYNNEEVDLNQIIEKLRSVLTKTIEENEVILSSDNLHTIQASSPQIFIILKNLIENAIKYNTKKQPTIHVSSEQVGKMHHIKVKDNGIGINEEYQSKIFTMFKRLHNRSTYEGVGIGLSICKKIVQNSGGDIWVESEEGIGSQFTFSIPVNKPS